MADKHEIAKELTEIIVKHDGRFGREYDNLTEAVCETYKKAYKTLNEAEIEANSNIEM